MKEVTKDDLLGVVKITELSCLMDCMVQGAGCQTPNGSVVSWNPIEGSH